MLKQNKKRLTISIYLVFLLLLPVNPLLYFAVPVSGSIAWSDDFNDGNYDGWTIKGLYAPVEEENSSEWEDTAGKAEVENGELRFTGQQILRNFTSAVRESSVAYGIWEFDVNVKPIYNTSNHTHIYIIDPRAPEYVPKFDSSFKGYDIFIYSAPWTIERPDYIISTDDLAPAFFLMRRPGMNIIGAYSVDEINGTYHFEVTRDETGRFKVYINDTLRIERVDTRWTTSQSFYLSSESGIGYDNIVVRDIEPTTTPTEPTTPDQGIDLVLLGGISVVAAVVFVAAAFILKRRR